ncbi:MAG: G5 domain-containing protein [Clostridia bacterium]|nr:G5 domain-containing protein [Clostridia bacterium]
MKSRFIFAMLLLFVFVFTNTGIYAAASREAVTIIDGDEVITVYTDELSVREIIAQQNIMISEGDVVYPSLNSQISDSCEIKITHLKRLDVTFEGKCVSYWTDAVTYREFIEKGIIGADSDDIYDVDLDAELKAFGNEMSIIKMTYTQECIEEEIPYESVTVYDYNLSHGERVLTTPGKKGIKTITYDVVYQDGKEISRTFAGEAITSQPVNEVVTEGQRAISVNGQIVPYKQMITCSATAYDLSFESCGKYPGDPGYGITASGTYAKLGTVAVDPRVIPLGTKMYIVSTDGSYVYGYCTAEDTGGAIKGNKVDLFYNTRSECMQFGRRSVNVYIL